MDDSEKTLAFAIDVARKHATDGDLREAFRHFEALFVRHGEAEALLIAASDLWVTAIDGPGLPTDWPAHEQDAWHLRLITQSGSSIAPPVFVHRLASQHSSGVRDHLQKAAAVLAPLLTRLADDANCGANTVLMLLLLRAFLPAARQPTISAHHLRAFPGFRLADLRIPYSIIFERKVFAGNIADLAAYVRQQNEKLLDGRLGLVHLLSLYWLVPESFDAMPIDWAARAIAADRNDAPDDAAAARSLAARFGLMTGNAAFDAIISDLAERRQRLGTIAPSPAAQKIVLRPWQAVNAGRNLVSRNLPRFSRRRRPRVAICVSGQLRGFEVALASWRRNLFPHIEPVIFLNSWSRIGRANAEPYRYVLPFEGTAFTAEYRSSGIELGLDAMKARYPAMFLMLDESNDISRESLSELYRTPHVHLDDDSAPEFAALTNSEKMHRKIGAAFDMAQASGQDFDLILRIRPDKPVSLIAFDWWDMVRATTNQPRIYAETAMGMHYGSLLMGDQFALSAPAAAQIYAETWLRGPSINRHDLWQFHKEFTGHVSLAQMCWLHGIEVAKIPMKFGTLQDPSPLPARLVASALAQDAHGRLDPIDRALIAANAADVAALGRQ